MATLGVRAVPVAVTIFRTLGALVTQAFQFRRPEGVQVTYRRMKFDFEDQGFERYWHGGSPFRSLFWSQLSTAFDPGEKFFIDSARAMRTQIQDPALLEELQAFCRQEGHHTAQHIKFDRMNAALGVDVDMCQRRYKRILDHARKNLEPMEMLAEEGQLSAYRHDGFWQPMDTLRDKIKLNDMWADNPPWKVWND